MSINPNTVKLNQFGFDIIIRHDYSNKEQLPQIQDYRIQSFNYFKKYLENYPKQLTTFLDVWCFDKFNVDLAKGLWLEAKGLDLYPIEKDDDIYVHDFYEMDRLWKTFDIIFVNHTLEHADSVYRLMEQIKKVHNKDWLLFISVPDGESEWAYSLYQSTTHFSILTYGFLLTTMQRFGYNVIPHRVELRPWCPELWFIWIKQ